MKSRIVFWFLFWVLLFLPITKSFFVNVGILTKAFLSNYQYKDSVSQLVSENNTLKNKVKYYNTLNGYKALIKERLEKVEKGEVLIKYTQ